MCFWAQLCEWGVSGLEGCYQQGRAPTLFQNPVSDSPSTPQSMGGSTPATLPVHVQKLKGDLSPKQNSVCTAACQGCWNMSHHGPHPNSADGRCLLEAYVSTHCWIQSKSPGRGQHSDTQLHPMALAGAHHVAEVCDNSEAQGISAKPTGTHLTMGSGSKGTDPSAAGCGPDSELLCV